MDAFGNNAWAYAVIILHSCKGRMLPWGFFYAATVKLIHGRFWGGGWRILYKTYSMRGKSGELGGHCHIHTFHTHALETLASRGRAW